MACEARIIRVLRTLGYPDVNDLVENEPRSFSERPDQLARIVCWIEDRKVRGRDISEREPLRTPGPAWEEAFFRYLRELNCPCLLNSTGQQGDIKAKASLLLQGVSWLVSKAVACEFEDNADACNGAARQVRLGRSILRNGSGVGHDDGLSTAETPCRLDQGLSPWSPEFLTALDAAFVGMGLKPPSISPPLPPPPPTKVQTPEPPRDDKDCDALVLQALEALLAEANRRFGRGSRTPGKILDKLEGFAAGVSTGDEMCDGVATVLRMMYLLDLRSLQDEINGILALAQASNKA